MCLFIFIGAIAINQLGFIMSETTTYEVLKGRGNGNWHCSMHGLSHLFNFFRTGSYSIRNSSHSSIHTHAYTHTHADAHAHDAFPPLYSPMSANEQAVAATAVAYSHGSGLGATGTSMLDDIKSMGSRFLFDKYDKSDQEDAGKGKEGTVSGSSTGRRPSMPRVTNKLDNIV